MFIKDEACGRAKFVWLDTPILTTFFIFSYQQIGFISQFLVYTLYTNFFTQYGGYWPLNSRFFAEFTKKNMQFTTQK